MIKVVCAVGDSFMSGQEVFFNEHPNAFPNLTESDRAMLELGTYADNKKIYDYYNARLNELIIPGIIANKLNVPCFNYSAPGASMESIKLQTYLLISTLKERGIDPRTCLWLVGLTPMTRLMFFDPYPEHHLTNIAEAAIGDVNYAMSRNSCQTFFCDRESQVHPRFDGFAKQLIVTKTNEDLAIAWAMNIHGILSVLRASGCEQIRILWHWQPQIFEFTQFIDHKTLLKLLTGIVREFEPYLSPAGDTPFNVHANYADGSWRCARGHWTAKVHMLVGQQILDSIV